MNQPATQTAHRPAAERSVVEQLTLNRSIVAAAENAWLRQAVHPARWERRGLFRRLRRQPGFAEIA